MYKICQECQSSSPVVDGLKIDAIYILEEVVDFRLSAWMLWDFITEQNSIKNFNDMGQNYLNLLFNFCFVYHTIIGAIGINKEHICVEEFLIELYTLKYIVFFSQFIKRTLIFGLFDENLC